MDITGAMDMVVAAAIVVIGSTSGLHQPTFSQQDDELINLPDGAASSKSKDVQ